MRGGRVAVVGGSIAGCAAALAAVRAGAAEVAVYERAAQRLQDRGVGLAVHQDRYAELEAAGYVDAGMPWVRLTRRVWLIGGTDARGGREIGVLPFPFRSYNWGSLWRELRARVPERVAYHSGAVVESVTPDADRGAGPRGAVLRFADGAEERFDLVIGADGYRSVVRAAMYPDVAPRYAGYLAWRGSLPAERLPGPREAWAEQDAASVAFPEGHMIVYRIPGPYGRGTSVNWVFYAVPPDVPGLRLDDPTVPPPRTVAAELIAHQQKLVARHFPPYWREVIERTRPQDTLVQPIFDLAVPHLAKGRLVLLGDSAAIARPHTGGGAVKALQDATVLERALRSAEDCDAGLAAYDAERAPIGRAVLELGRRLGRAQVLSVPDWAAMDQRSTEEWWRAASEGERGFGGHALGG
ncbi:FAD-dependent monooxygenase [Streptomyces sp. NPDC050617]|uniref:FAD-dependent monooxygenase n=1 Tax=Streptomyces sp. NPDC050617 TaxID=3154628 RepID=UPI0034392505